jgi:hypothetical protein
MSRQEQTAQALTVALARLSQVEGELVRLAKPTPKAKSTPPPPQAPAPTPAEAPPVDSRGLADHL